MKALKTTCLLIAVLFSANAFSCEKWKSEIASLAWSSKKYYNIYRDYKNGEMGKSAFVFESESIISDINDLISYAEKTQSCEHDSGKFEERKQKLINFANKAVIVMRAGEFLEVFK